VQGVGQTHDMHPLVSESDSVRALRACLARLSHSITEGRPVRVVDSWADGPDMFSVVYVHPLFDGLLGLRRRVEFEAGIDTPEEFGADVAEFDIAEPLGSIAKKLHPDSSGIHWWGDT
jgi:hypothetical protein